VVNLLRLCGIQLVVIVRGNSFLARRKLMSVATGIFLIKQIFISRSEGHRAPTIIRTERSYHRAWRIETQFVPSFKFKPLSRKLSWCAFTL